MKGSCGARNESCLRFDHDGYVSHEEVYKFGVVPGPAIRFTVLSDGTVKWGCNVGFAHGQIYLTLDIESIKKILHERKVSETHLIAECDQNVPDEERQCSDWS